MSISFDEVEKFHKNLESEYNQFLKKIQKANILLIGQSGSGKKFRLNNNQGKAHL